MAAIAAIAASRHRFFMIQEFGLAHPVTNHNVRHFTGEGVVKRVAFLNELYETFNITHRETMRG
ncbi:MAG TPA: hypothetical protein PLI01_00425 [Nitrospira sp.]|nr:hypothetical protein [Nitrospira sp.]HNA25224.1 hypothetical protein [Nitrospira sp.]HNI17514.1 hypothetical protein [Nitrospira sp.]